MLFSIIKKIGLINGKWYFMRQWKCVLGNSFDKRSQYLKEFMQLAQTCLLHFYRGQNGYYSENLQIKRKCINQSNFIISQNCQTRLFLVLVFLLFMPGKINERCNFKLGFFLQYLADFCFI